VKSGPWRVPAPPTKLWRTTRSADDRLVGSLLAAIVHPGDLDLVALRAALELERQERILGDRRAPLRVQHGLAIVRDDDVLDEPRGYDLALRILALARLHLVTHQHAHLGRVADDAGPDFHRIWHM